VKQYMTLQ